MTPSWLETVGVTYSPGNWLAGARMGAWLLMEDSSHGALARRCWDRLGEETSTFEQILDVLVSDGIERAPNFALAMPHEDSLRIVVRGSASAAWTGDSGDEGKLVTHGPSIWSEAVLPAGVATVTLSGDSEAPEMDLPLGQAMALASAIRLEMRPRSAQPSPEARSGTSQNEPVTPASQNSATSAEDRQRTPAAITAEIHDDEAGPSGSPGLPVPVPPSAGLLGAKTERPGTTSAAADEAQKKDQKAPAPSYDHLFGATGRTILTKPAPEPMAAPSAPSEAHAALGEAVESSPAMSEPLGTQLSPGQPGSELPSREEGGIIHLPPWAEGAKSAAPVPSAGPGGQPARAAVSQGQHQSAPAPANPAQLAEARPVLPSAQAQPTSPAPPPLRSSPPPPPPPPPRHESPALEKTRDRSTLGLPNSSESGRLPVLAALCPQGHANEPNTPTCRVCRQPVPRQPPIEILRPPLGLLRLSTGAVVTLDRGVVMGRDPVIPEHSKASHPNSLRVASPERDVSRTHLEVFLERWHVLVRDLGSKNGTVIMQPGQAPVRLRPEEPQLLEPGAVVTMAEEVSFVFEAVP